jgi:hypothetical protein
MLSIYQIGERLKGLTFAEAAAKLGEFESYSRSVALAFVLCRANTSGHHPRVSGVGKHLRCALVESRHYR